MFICFVGIDMRLQYIDSIIGLGELLRHSLYSLEVPIVCSVR